MEVGLAGHEMSLSADTAGISTPGWRLTLLQRKYCFKKNKCLVSFFTFHFDFPGQSITHIEMKINSEMAF